VRSGQRNGSGVVRADEVRDADGDDSRSVDGKARRYPPIAGGALALVLAAFVLPSALDVPQTNPTVTPEFAPVPESDDDSPPPPGGNIGALGLGSSGGVGATTTLPPPPPPEGKGETPRGKQCVGNPPRQTADRLSPPCVASFTGDNFGETYQGVSGEEVRIVVVGDPNLGRSTDAGVEDEGPLHGRCIDVASPEGEETVSVTIRNLRRFQTFFNERYQTYERRVRFTVCFNTTASNPTTGTSEGPTPETRQADAVNDFARVKPFAVLTSQMEAGFEQPYVETMAERGVLSFGSKSGSQRASFYQRHPGLIWSYLPSVEKQAEVAIEHLCRKVVDGTVVDAGAAFMGQPRKLGFLSTTDAAYPQLQYLASLVKAGLERCGASLVEATFPVHGVRNQVGQDDPQALYATRNMARFQQEGVTTIIWAGGWEREQTKAATQLDYYPEWVVVGDGVHEATGRGQDQDRSQWEHAWSITQVTRIEAGGGARNDCIDALQSVDPSIGEDDIFWGCFDMPWYRDIRQLFNGIQVAGPRLSPESIDRGFHAIPPVASDDPRYPGCFYDPGDYTCVKDATVIYWDPLGKDPNPDVTVVGCWRMVEDGRRYTARTWPDGNLDAQLRAARDEECNSYDITVSEF
jgi:hypothetical protein